MRDLEDKMKETSQNPEEKYKELEILRGRIGELEERSRSSNP